MQDWVCVPNTDTSPRPSPRPRLTLISLSSLPFSSSLQSSLGSSSIGIFPQFLPPADPCSSTTAPTWFPTLAGNATTYSDNTVSITMELADKAIGFLFSILSLSIFTYYTFWVIILPFVESDHFIHRYFLPQEFAILIPVFAGMALLSLLCIFVGFVMLKSKKKKA